MTITELQELLEFHIDRARKKEYDALTVETKVLEKSYELLFPRQYSDRYRTDQGSEKGAKDGHR